MSTTMERAMEGGKTTAPFVSVVIPTYDDARLVLALEALRGQTYDRDRYEVVVCDNGSHIDVGRQLEPVAHDMPVRLVAERRPGSYQARNAALRATRGSILAFTDADCLPAADWIACGVAALTTHDADLIAGRVDIFAGGFDMTAAEVFEAVHAFPQRRYVERDGFGATANLFVRRDVVDRIGPFDAALRSGGDREFCQRATAAGFALAYDAATVVRHPARRHLRELRRKQRRTSRGLFASGTMTPSLKDAVMGFRPPLRRLVRARSDQFLREHDAWGRFALATTCIHYGFALDRLRHVLGFGRDHR